MTIPAGIAPGQSVPFSTTVKLPSTPIPGVTTGVVYIDEKIDPNEVVPETNRGANSGVGIPYESSYIVITPEQPSNLMGSTLAVSAPTTAWGSTITVTAQIRNAGAGSSPATRAMLVLTPTGTAPTWPNFVSIGNLSVPAIPAYQTVNLVQNITLPANVPTLLDSNGNTAFTLSMIQDADYVTNASYPHQPDVGLGYDLVNMTINPSPTATTALRPAGPRGWVGLTVLGLTFVGREFPGQHDLAEPRCRQCGAVQRAVPSDRSERQYQYGHLPWRSGYPGPCGGLQPAAASDAAAPFAGTGRDDFEQRRLRQDCGDRRCREHGQRESDQQQPG